MKQSKWLLALILIAITALFCLSANAATTISVSTSSQLVTAVNTLSVAGGTIRMTADIDVASTTLPQNSGKITLDGDGHILTLGGNLVFGGDYDIKNITFHNYGTYRTIACGGHKVHFFNTVNCTASGSIYPSIMAGFITAQAFDGAQVTVDGGTWQRVRGGNANSTAGAFVQSSLFTVNGGTFNEVFQVAGGGDIPSGSSFTANIYGGRFKNGFRFYNTTGSATAETVLNIYGGEIDGTVSIADAAANVGGSALVYLYDGDYSACTGISSYSGAGSVNAQILIEKGLADRVYGAERSTSTLSSSLLRTGVADPCLITCGDTYYLTMTGTSNIALLKSKDISALAGMTISPNIVYRGAQDTNATENLGYTELSGTWSPEIHYFSEEEFGENAGWYMYLALRKKTGDSSDISMVALKSATGDTPDGPYVHPTTGATYVSQTILDKNGKPFNEEWGCGMSIFRIESGPYAGVYATWVGEENRGNSAFRQMIWIAKLRSPWQLDGDASVIMYPTQDWEKICKGYTNGTYYPEVVEGATAVYGKDGQVYMLYSGGGYWWTYGIGQMTWNGGNPLSASSWVKYENNPTFACNSVSGSRYTHYSGLLLQGAGHATYFTDADGQMYAVYHAYPCDATGDKGSSPSRNAYIETCYIDYSKNNGVNRGVLMVGNGSGKPVNPDSSPALTITLQSEGYKLADLCDANTELTRFTELEAPTLTAQNRPDGSVLLTIEDDNPAGTTYRIARATDGVSFTPVTTVDEKQYLDTDITVGTTYTYRVEPYNDYFATASVSGAVTGLPAMPTVSAKTLTDDGKRVDLLFDISVPSGATCRTTYSLNGGAWNTSAVARRIYGLTLGATYTVRLESKMNVGGVDYFSLPLELNFTAEVPTLTLTDATASGFTAAWTFPTGVTSPTYKLGDSATALANAQADSRTETGLAGYTDYTVTVEAVRDGMTLRTVASIKTLCAHDYGEGVETSPATYTENGLRTYTCSICGDVKEVVIPMLESAQYYEALTEGAVYTAIETRADGGDFAIRSFTKYGVPAGTAVFELPEELADKETYYVYRLVGDFMILTDYEASPEGLVIDAADGDVYAVSDAPLVSYGDVNADGGMTLADVLRTMRCLAGEDVSADLAAADYNGSASLTLLDALAILLAVLNG